MMGTTQPVLIMIRCPPVACSASNASLRTWSGVAESQCLA